MPSNIFGLDCFGVIIIWLDVNKLEKAFCNFSLIEFDKINDIPIEVKDNEIIIFVINVRYFFAFIF